MLSKGDTPQVYKSNDRLLLKSETIGIGHRTFMISIISLFGLAEILDHFFSRTCAFVLAVVFLGVAIPRAIQFVPLLDDTLEKVKQVVHRVIPVEKKLSSRMMAERRMRWRGKPFLKVCLVLYTI